MDDQFNINRKFEVLKMRKYICMVSLIAILLTACSMSQGKDTPEVAKPGQSNKMPGQNNDPQNSPVQAKETGKLSIWSFYDLGQEMRDLIKKRLPDVEVDYKVIPSFELIKTYTAAYNKGELPDVFLLDPILMGSFNSTNAFVDLSAAPYNAEPKLSEYPANIKPALHSFDGKKLLAMPIELIPGVTFYRYDAMKAAGFPAEPEELAEYMEDMDNWLNMAKTFKKSDKHIVAVSSEPLLYADVGYNLFDQQFNFTRNSDIFIKTLELGRTIDALGLASNANLMDMNDKNTLQTGKTVMFQSTMLHTFTLKEAVKGTGDGQWRMTRLPFGLYTWAGSVFASIPSESKNKNTAWAVLELITNRHLTHMSEIMKPDGNKNLNDSLFGNQDINKLYRTLIEGMPKYNLTPLDEKARAIWWTEWSKDISNLSISSGTLINKWSQTVEEQLDKDIAALKNNRLKIHN